MREMLEFYSPQIEDSGILDLLELTDQAHIARKPSSRLQ